MSMGEMRVVAITGRSGSGKSLLSGYYASLGYPVADGDALSREVCLPESRCLQELRLAFGDGILAQDGSLNRAALGELVFQDPEKNALLVSITHPHIIEAFLQRAEKARSEGARLFFMDGAVIVGGPFQQYCDKIIVVTTQQHLAVSRIILRDGISKTAAYNRLSAQLPEAELVAAADYVVENNGSEQALCRRADEILKELLDNP